MKIAITKKIWVLICIIPALALLLSVAFCYAGGASEDVIWSGVVEVAENVTIPVGSTLVIRAGTEVRLGRNVTIYINGAIQAVGSSSERIVFTSMENNPSVGDWGEINFFEAAESSFVNCDFEYASWGVHCHDTRLLIESCRFFNNDGGIRFRGGPMMVRGSLFKGNRIGIRSFRGEGNIRGNLFAANEIAVFVRQRGDLIKINRNGFENIDRYAIRLGDFNVEDVDARENWWAGVNPVDFVFDSHQEPYIGTVKFEPLLKEPVVVKF